jgi:hypothetical protein
MIAIAASLLATAGPASAFGAQRFASPAGTGSTCSQPAPCSLVTAVNSATPGDEVIVAGNQRTYGSPSSPITTQLADPGNINLHGAGGQPTPVIYMNYGSGSLVAVSMNNGGTISDLHIENLASNGTAVFIGNSADHLVAKGGAEGCEPIANVTIIDTVCAGGSFGIGVSVGSSGTQTTTLRNLTVLGGTGYGISLDAASFNWIVNASNVIARGAFKDISTTTSGGGSLTVNLDHSNYANTQAGAGTSITPVGSGTNQTASPLFVNATGGDLHEATGSPTIDAGISSPLNGTTDLDGNPRTIGSATDIGAYEYVPPTPPSPGPTGQRAAALKRCKKRAHKHHWSHKRLKKCKKNANLLPV